VRNRVSTIFSKVGVNSRAQAIVWAREAGFGRTPAGP
jgi:DNA-binding NarL/FixJ family response regulator